MEVTTTASAPGLRWPAAAVALALPWLAGFVLLLVRLSFDREHRQELERTVEVTAVGDMAWYLPPKPEPSVPIAVTTYGGQQLLPVSYRHIELRDSRLTPVGMDDAGKLRIYTTREPIPARPGEPERHNEPVFLIKLGPEQYLKVQPAR